MLCLCDYPDNNQISKNLVSYFVNDIMIFVTGRKRDRTEKWRRKHMLFWFILPGNLEGKFHQSLSYMYLLCCYYQIYVFEVQIHTEFHHLRLLSWFMEIDIYSFGNVPLHRKWRSWYPPVLLKASESQTSTVSSFRKCSTFAQLNQSLTRYKQLIYKNDHKHTLDIC